MTQADPAYSVDVNREYAYVSFDARFAIVDVSDPDDPVEKGYLLLPNTIRDIVVVDGIAYLSWRYGLSSIDVSDPVNPRILDVTVDEALYMVADSIYLFVTTAAHFLKTIDISDPVDLKEVASFEVVPHTSTGLFDIVLDNETIYLLGRHPDNIWLVDVSNPLIPAEVERWDRGRFAIEIQDNILYNGEAGCSSTCSVSLTTFDISNVAEPVVLDQFADSNNSVFDLARHEGWIMMGTRYGMYVIDAHDPTQLKRLTYYTAPFVVDIAVSFPYAYLATDNGLEIVQFTQPIFLPLITQ